MTVEDGIDSAGQGRAPKRLAQESHGSSLKRALFQTRKRGHEDCVRLGRSLPRMAPHSGGAWSRVSARTPLDLRPCALEKKSEMNLNRFVIYLSGALIRRVLLTITLLSSELVERALVCRYRRKRSLRVGQGQKPLNRHDPGRYPHGGQAKIG